MNEQIIPLFPSSTLLFTSKKNTDKVSKRFISLLTMYAQRNNYSAYIVYALLIDSRRKTLQRSPLYSTLITMIGIRFRVLTFKFIVKELLFKSLPQYQMRQLPQKWKRKRGHCCEDVKYDPGYYEMVHTMFCFEFLYRRWTEQLATLNIHSYINLPHDFWI